MKLTESKQEMGETYFVVAEAGIDGNLDIRPLDEVVAAARALPSKWKEKPDPLGELAAIRHGDEIIGPPNGFSLNQSANDAANRPHPDTLAARLAKLEAEVATLRAEVQMLRAGQLQIVDLRRSAATFGTDFICETR